MYYYGICYCHFNNNQSIVKGVRGRKTQQLLPNQLPCINLLKLKLSDDLLNKIGQKTATIKNNLTSLRMFMLVISVIVYKFQRK